MKNEEREEGIVTAVDDPAKAGRIKVRMQSMDGGEFPEWIEPELPPGFVVLPLVGDRVSLSLPAGGDLVEFAEEVRWTGVVGDTAHPVPQSFKTNYPKRTGYWTKSGHLLIFDDKSGSEEITISHKGTMLISLTNDGIFIGTQSADQPVVLGTLWQSMISGVLGALAAHVHTGVTTGSGSSGPPADASPYTSAKTAVDNGDHLSDFIFAQKAKP